jgi:hypothetical protein
LRLPFWNATDLIAEREQIPELAADLHRHLAALLSRTHDDGLDHRLGCVVREDARVRLVEQLLQRLPLPAVKRRRVRTAGAVSSE